MTQQADVALLKFLIAQVEAAANSQDSEWEDEERHAIDSTEPSVMCRTIADIASRLNLMHLAALYLARAAELSRNPDTRLVLLDSAYKHALSPKPIHLDLAVTIGMRIVVVSCEALRACPAAIDALQKLADEYPGYPNLAEFILEHRERSPRLANIGGLATITTNEKSR